MTLFFLPSFIPTCLCLSQSSTQTKVPAVFKYQSEGTGESPCEMFYVLDLSDCFLMVSCNFLLYFLYTVSSVQKFAQNKVKHFWQVYVLWHLIMSVCPLLVMLKWWQLTYFHREISLVISRQSGGQCFDIMWIFHSPLRVCLMVLEAMDSSFWNQLFLWGL